MSRVELLLQVGAFCVAVGALIAGASLAKPEVDVYITMTPHMYVNFLDSLDF